MSDGRRDESSTNYVALSDGAPAPPRRWGLLPLVVLLAIGGHAATHALASAEPALHAAGLSPSAFGVLTIMPQLSAMLLPGLWGEVFERNAHLALALAPAGLFIGQCALTVALVNQDPKPSPLLTGTRIAGICIFAVSRAGLPVVQQACLARALPTRLVGAFAASVGATHAVGALSQLATPPLVHAYGLVGSQFLLLPLALLGLSAAILIIRRGLPPPPPPPPPPTPEKWPAQRLDRVFFIRCTGCGVAVPRSTPYETECAACVKAAQSRWRERRAVLLMAMYRASSMGSSHAFINVANGLFVSHGMTREEAGRLLAACGIASLAALPASVFAAAHVPVRALFAPLSTVLALCAAVLVATQEVGGDDASWSGIGAPEGRWWWAPRLALGGLMTGATAGAVLENSFVPSLSPSPARAYGTIEGAYVGGMAGSTLLIGAVREMDGFRGVLWFLLSGMLVSTAVAGCLACCVGQQAPMYSEPTPVSKYASAVPMPVPESLARSASDAGWTARGNSGSDDSVDDDLTPVLAGGDSRGRSFSTP